MPDSHEMAKRKVPLGDVSMLLVSLWHVPGFIFASFVSQLEDKWTKKDVSLQSQLKSKSIG